MAQHFWFFKCLGHFAYLFFDCFKIFYSERYSSFIHFPTILCSKCFQTFATVFQSDLIEFPVERLWLLEITTLLRGGMLAESDHHWLLADCQYFSRVGVCFFLHLFNHSIIGFSVLFNNSKYKQVDAKLCNSCGIKFSHNHFFTDL